jgi:hypothetical protein
MRVRTRWHNESIERDENQIASTLAYVCWKSTLESIQNMQDWGFEFGSLQHHFPTASEFAAFLVQAVDRYAYERMEREQRTRLMSALIGRLIGMITENQQEMLGPGEYRKPLIDTFNHRFADYAELGWDEDGPSFGAMRYLASQVVDCLPQENRAWIEQQLIEIEAPKAIENLMKGLHAHLDHE